MPPAINFQTTPEQERRIEGAFLAVLVLIVAVIAWPILSKEL